MLAKDYLLQYKKIQQKIQDNEEEILNLKTLATKTNHPLKGERVQGSPNLDPMGSKVIEWCDLESETESLKQQAEIVKIQIQKVLHQVKGKPRTILYQRYLMMMKFTDIASADNSSIRTIRRYHDDGLNQVQIIIENWHLLPIIGTP